MKGIVSHTRRDINKICVLHSIRLNHCSLPPLHPLKSMTNQDMGSAWNIKASAPFTPPTAPPSSWRSKIRSRELAMTFIPAPGDTFFSAMVWVSAQFFRIGVLILVWKDKKKESVNSKSSQVFGKFVCLQEFIHMFKEHQQWDPQSDLKHMRCSTWLV